MSMEAPRPKRDIVDDCAGGVGDLGVLRQIELRDRRLRAAAFLMAWGGCIVLHGTMFNRSANAEHVLAGFFLWSIGSAIALLALGSAGTAAARLEEALRRFF